MSSETKTSTTHISAGLRVGFACGALLSVNSDIKNDEINLGTTLRAIGGGIVGGVFTGCLEASAGESHGFATTLIVLTITGIKLLDIKRRR